MSLNHKLMNNIPMRHWCCKKFLKNRNIILTQSKKLKNLKKWSKWLGIRYSHLLTQVHQYNFITISILK